MAWTGKVLSSFLFSLYARSQAILVDGFCVSRWRKAAEYVCKGWKAGSSSGCISQSFPLVLFSAGYTIASTLVILLNLHACFYSTAVSLSCLRIVRGHGCMCQTHISGIPFLSSFSLRFSSCHTFHYVTRRPFLQLYSYANVFLTYGPDGKKKQIEMCLKCQLALGCPHALLVAIKPAVGKLRATFLL